MQLKLWCSRVIANKTIKKTVVSAGLVPCGTVTHQTGANHSLCANWVN